MYVTPHSDHHLIPYRPNVAGTWELNAAIKLALIVPLLYLMWIGCFISHSTQWCTVNSGPGHFISEVTASGVQLDSTADFSIIVLEARLIYDQRKLYSPMTTYSD